MARKLTALKRPVRRSVVVEGVVLVITLSERALSARVKYRRQVYTHSLSALFLSALTAAKRRQAGPLPQEEMDLRVPREA